MTRRQLWAMAALKASLTAMIGGATTWVTSMAGLDWSAMSPTNKAIVLIGAIVTAGNTVAAFLDRSISRIEQNLPPEANGDKMKL